MGLNSEWQDFIEDIIGTKEYEDEPIKYKLEYDSIIAQIKDHHKKLGLNVDKKDYEDNFENSICLDTFSVFKENKDKIIEEKSFDEATFEKHLDTGIGSTSIDFFLENKDAIIGIDSRFTEMLKMKLPNRQNELQNYINRKELSYLPDGFDKLARYYIDLKEELYLDVVRLIKISMGILNNKNERQARLLYIYWAPLNYRKLEMYQKHFSEIETFKNKMRRYLSFKSITYDKFWSFYQDNELFKDHIAKLRNKYNFECLLPPSMSSPL